MNIRFGDDNFYVKYLKRFLNSELSRSSTVLGEFDRNDLEMLIQYLNLPNVKTMFEVQKEIEDKFPGLKDLFLIQLRDNLIIWSSKTISVETSEYITEYRDDIKEYCESVGWELSDIQEYVDTTMDINQDGVVNQDDREIIYNLSYNIKQYDENIRSRADLDLDGEVTLKDLSIFDNYVDNGKLYITIKQSNRKNYFPNKDMLVFINQFDGTFLQNYAIRNGVDIDDKPHQDTFKTSKIALYKCKPGQKVTIAHNNRNTTRLVIGCSPAVRKNDIQDLLLYNVVDVKVKPEEGYQYTCSSRKEGTGLDANWLCIQCPSDYSSLEGQNTQTLTLQAGDINFDGKIDWLDYHLLARYTATGPGSEELHWQPTSKQLAVMNIDVQNEPAGTISNKDTIMLYRYLTGDPAVMDLGVAYYSYDSNTMKDVDNVSNLLIIDGHYDKNVNIPFEEFLTDPWCVHEKFFNYLLNMAVQPYSDSENITYLQKLMKEIYPEHLYDDNFFYPGKYSEEMRYLIKQYQTSKVKYTQGDLNKDNELTKEDLEMLKQYIDDSEKLNTIRKIINYEIEPTPEQIAELDQNKDGRVSKNDYDLFNEYMQKTYPADFVSRADVNQDGYIDQVDYDLLEKAVNGETDELTSYQIPFILGWYDVQTENLLESEINSGMNISEVSK